MKTIRLFAILLTAGHSLLAGSPASESPAPKRLPPPNPQINYKDFLTNANAVRKLREERRLTEADFLKMAEEAGTLVLDARSVDKFNLLHFKGAKHLALTDVTADELARVIPDKKTRVLIYCNNNFRNEPSAFASKAPAASLNLYTFNTLYSYGYENVYELGPLIDINNSILPFEGARAELLNSIKNRSR